MLVLDRNRRKKTIWIGRDVKVTLISIGRGHVKLGIDAPPEVPVWREELEPPGAPIDNCDSSEAA